MRFSNEELVVQEPQSAKPCVPPLTAPSVEPIPDDTWSDNDLLQYGRTAIIRGDRDEERQLVLGRRSIKERLDAGHALAIVRQRHKGDGTWCKMQDEHGLSRTTVWEVIEVYEQSAALGHTQEDVAAKHDTWTEVLVAYGVVRNRAAKEVAADDTAQIKDLDQEQGPVLATELPSLDHAEQPEVDAKQDSCNAYVAPPAPDQAEQPGKATANKPPKVKAVKKEQIDISPCEIDAATAFVQAVGNWARAVVVLQAVKDIVGVKP